MKTLVPVFVRMCKNVQQAMCLIQRHANVCAMEGFPRRPFMTDFANANKTTIKFLTSSHVAVSVHLTYNVMGI